MVIYLLFCQQRSSSEFHWHNQQPTSKTVLYNITRKNKNITIILLPSKGDQEIPEGSEVRLLTYEGDEANFIEPMRAFNYQCIPNIKEGYVQITVKMKQNRDLTDDEENLILSFGRAKIEFYFRTVERQNWKSSKNLLAA